MDYITYLIVNDKDEKLHYNNEKGFYLDEKIHYNDLLTYYTRDEALEELNDKELKNFSSFDDLKVEAFFEVDDILAPLDDTACFVSNMWDGERINFDEEEEE